ncbi:NTP transferase domain-containing protein [Schinkia azotoformans]|uniref:Xanthine dehydrogenase n=1 Tax=Schinkia azotoformans LMG 9581 TaxID=1131731 RepID=K6CWG3_SCHAZ|nr:NTP transferase domain-containing protein [Schinkia azotoformans]EKN64562.1 xanthine dehydrogenase [Schinkia azotoformans LMG 9581]MEC1637873.1 NTP transferase domain-containing protein [Schinkia azotoformans]MEC1944769.1 NTP transferase domain-containing protein [Schinkia azotoformans]MED4354121.1 NTP transferase domain-containing protein [Schinkia azotoformans]
MTANHRSIVGIYLAAGRGSRMGQNKLVLPLGNHPLGSYALRTALHSELDHIIVVFPDEEWTLKALKPYFTEKITAIQCPNSHLGLSYSLNFGIQSSHTTDVAGVVILLADQPFIHFEMINSLINIFRQEKVDYVASSFNNIIRPPFLIGKQLFPLLQQLKGDNGAKKLLTGNSVLNGRVLPYENERLFFDIDTMEEYEEALKRGEANCISLERE